MRYEYVQLYNLYAIKQSSEHTYLTWLLVLLFYVFSAVKDLHFSFSSNTQKIHILISFYLSESHFLYNFSTLKNVSAFMKIYHESLIWARHFIIQNHNGFKSIVKCQLNSLRPVVQSLLRQLNYWLQF